MSGRDTSLLAGYHPVHILIQNHSCIYEAGRESVQSCQSQRVATLKSLKFKIYFDLFNTCLVTTWFHMCYFRVLMSSVLLFAYLSCSCQNMDLVFYQIELSSVYQPYLVTTQLMFSLLTDVFTIILQCRK